jgi:mono/diheme cytochrome c family protein
VRSHCTPINTRLGLVPRRYSTGSKSILGRISKRSSRYIPSFIQAANIILMRPHNWEKFSYGASSRVCPTTSLRTLAAFTAQQTWFATFATREQVALGKKIFHGEVAGATCAGCHGAEGIGTPVGGISGVELGSRAMAA